MNYLPKTSFKSIFLCNFLSWRWRWRWRWRRNLLSFISNSFHLKSIIWRKSTSFIKWRNIFIVEIEFLTGNCCCIKEFEGRRRGERKSERRCCHVWWFSFSCPYNFLCPFATGLVYCICNALLCGPDFYLIYGPYGCLLYHVSYPSSQNNNEFFP